MVTSTSKKTKSHNRKERGKSIEKLPVEAPKTRRFFLATKKFFSSILFWVLALISIVSFLFLVYPRISIDPGESLDPYKPFETPFVIKNDGYWSLVNITCKLSIDNMKDISGNKFRFGTIRGMSSRIAKLRANESSSIMINRVFVTPPGFIKYVELYIIVTYKPYIGPWTFTENRRFKTARKSDGQYVWLKYFSEK